MRILDLVNEYYSRIDAGDIEWVERLFAESATYDRAGCVYKGIRAISDFYKDQRKVKLSHRNLRFWDLDQDVFVEGIFQGHGADGSPRRGAFADHWTFDQHGRVTFRRTSLFAGSNIIRC